MKSLFNKIIIGGAIIGASISGCQDSRSTKTKPYVEPPVVENSAPVFNSNTCPTVIYENTSGTCKLSATDADEDPVKYSFTDSLDGLLSIDSTTGDVSWNASEVDADTIYSTTAKACDDKDACDSKTLDITVKNVEENVLPVIQGLALSGTASADANNIYQTLGKNIDGRIVAIDANDDAINYNTDVSGDALSLNSEYEDEFSIATQQTSTDSTTDLGQVIMNACDEEGCDTKTFNVVGKNPIQANISQTFYENGMVEWSSDATSDGSYLSQVQGWMNDGGKGDVDITSDTYTKSAYISDEIIEGTNTGKFSWKNEDGDERIIEGSFVPATEAEARAKIEEILNAWGGTYVKDDSLNFNAIENPLCQYSKGTPLSISVDYLVVNGDKIATINYASFGNNLSTDLDNYNTLKNCGNTANDLQMSRFPVDEVESKTTAFKDNEFMDVE